MDELHNIIHESDPFKSWWPYIIAIVVGVSMTIRSIMGGKKCPNTNNIDKQIVIITGCSSGIGYEICKALLYRKACIIMACKDIEKTNKLVTILKREIKLKIYNNSNENDVEIVTKYLDLKSFDNIKRFVRDIETEYNRVDILINNAGIIFNEYEKTADGVEQHLQVNYLGGFLLINLLVPLLEKSENARVINTTAHAYANGKMSIEDPLNIGTWAENFHNRDAFAHSKLAVILGTKALATKLKESKITINAYMPGLVRGTNHLRRSPIMSAFCIKLMTFPWMWLFMKTPIEGAQCAIYLATEPKLKEVTGELFNDCEIVSPTENACNEKLVESLYKESMKILKLNF